MIVVTTNDLPGHRIPQRLRVLCSYATGKDFFECWQFGDGPFINGEMTTGLSLRVDRSTHGVIEPSHEIPAHEYQASLAATRENWSLVPETVSINEALA